MGWLDGALRIMPSWEWTGWGHTLPFEVFLPAVIFPGIVFNLCFGWPMLERIFTKDNELHNLLDRPRDRPKRTGAGAAMLALLFTLFAASSTDVLAKFFQVSLNEVLWFFRIATVVVPVIVGFTTWRICLEMQGVHGVGPAEAGPGGVATDSGEYLAVPSDPRPGDGAHELEAQPVPARIDLEPETVVAAGGVRRVNR